MDLVDFSDDIGLEGKDVFQLGENNNTVSEKKDSKSGDRAAGDSSGTSKGDKVDTKVLSATIPLGDKDKTPEYDKKTLRAFDKKFREWEQQFESWKEANANHPDKEAYKKYLDQWNLWREQLVEQRRFIIDSMNKARLEAGEKYGLKPLSNNESRAEGSGSAANFGGSKPGPNTTGSSKTLLLTPSSQKQVRQQPGDFESTTGRREFPMSMPSADQDVEEFPPTTGPAVFMTGNRPGIRPGMAPKGNQYGAPRNAQRPPSLMSLPSSAPVDNRHVERIPRDRNRPDVAGPSVGRDSDRPSGQNMRAEIRIMRDISPAKPAVNNPFTLEEVTWEAQSNSNANPFDIRPNANEGRNPFELDERKGESTNPWGSTPANTQAAPASSNKLPTLSDFLNKDECKVTDDYLNRRGFGGMTQKAGYKREESPVRRSPLPPDDKPKLEFEPTQKLLPLVVASKPKQPPPLPVVHDRSPEVDAEFVRRERGGPDTSWFTRDRGGGFEEDEYTGEGINDTSASFVSSGVIDYGHGTGSNHGVNDEEDEYDLPRGERLTENEDFDDDDARLPNAVTIDYGHGSTSTAPEFDSFEPPATNRDKYWKPQPQGSFRERQPFDPYRGAHVGRGRGRGIEPFGRRNQDDFYNQALPNPNFENSFTKPLKAASPPVNVESVFDKVEFDENWEDEPLTTTDHKELMMTPAANRGKGRGAPVRFRTSPPDDQLGHPDIRPRARDNSRSNDHRVEREPSNRRRSRSRDRDEDDWNQRSRRDRSRKDSDRRKGSERDREYDSYSSRGVKRNRSRSPISERISRDPSSDPQSGFPASNPPAPRYQSVLIEDILSQPGRVKRPSQIVVILRGLPGSGKSHVAKLIKDKEMEKGENAPRILSLDDYFMQEVEKKVKDPKTKMDVVKTVMEYEYEAALEPRYRNDLLKTFKKTVENGYHPFIIVDCVNEKVKHFEEIAAFAEQRRFQVYVADVEDSIESCVKRNVHHRSREEIIKIQKGWEVTPSKFIRLDIRTLLQDEAVQDVEMEDVVHLDNSSRSLSRSPVRELQVGKERWEDEEEQPEYPAPSKWETLQSEGDKNRLDGLMRKRAAKDDDKVDPSSSIESWLQSHVPEDYVFRQATKPGQKRVRWADIEERRAQERMRDMGFVVGHTDWNRMTDPTFGSSALTRTKYI